MTTTPGTDLAARYGVIETNGLVDGYHDTVDYTEPYTLADLAAEGGKVTRLRMLTERGYPYLDISYAHGTLPDGRTVPLVIPAATCPGAAPSALIIEWAKAEGVYAKDLGLLDEGNWSILYG